MAGGNKAKVNDEGSNVDEEQIDDELGINIDVQDDSEMEDLAEDLPEEDESFNMLVGDSPLCFHGDDVQGSHISKVYRTPNGTRYWCPQVDDEFKPVVGKVYKSFNEALQMYENYGDKAGFSIRCTAFKRYKNVVTHRLLSCNRAGTPRCHKFSSAQPMSISRIRGTSSRLTNCKAYIRLSIVKGTDRYLLYEFSENHNHRLISSDNMDLTRKAKHINFDDIQFVHTMSLQKIGPVIAHRLQTQLKGGHHNMHGTRNTFKNITKEIRMFIGCRDINLFLKRLKERSATMPNFAYEILHDGSELSGVFWADDVSRVSYKSFGDVIAFDATYSTNKYNMIFVPFTGVDHHKKCVLFGAGLIRDETINSYEWLLQSFLSVHVIQPKLVLTDQDPTLRVVVPNVFNNARHRLCMWHIMKKLPSKVSGDLLQNTDLRRSIHKLVWNVFIPPSSFEERWERLIQQYQLQHNIWLNDMYDIRNLWVPAYFRDFPMCCLMKTTSRCESSNAMFKLTSSHSNTLSQFLMAFDSAVDQQRYGQRIEEFNTNTSTPEVQSSLDIEKHAAKLYTRAIFKDMQKEILKSMLTCFITNVDVEDNRTVYTISHFNHYSDYVNEFKVYAHLLDNSYECSCNGFTRSGYLCRHVFLALRFKKITEIPGRYVIPRWMKQALPSRLYNIENRLSADTSDFCNVRNEVLDSVNECFDHLCGKMDSLNCFAEKIKEIKKEVLAEGDQITPVERRAAVLRKYFKTTECETNLSAPQGIRNKGCGTNKRLVGPGEKAIETSKKNPRLCRSCNQIGYHDSRNCKGKSKEGPSSV